MTNGNGNYTTGPFTTTAAGDYNWVAVYSGDANNASVTSPCGAPNETSTVTQAQPAIVTQASGPVSVGQPITDTATLSGGVATPPATGPTGTITFTLFGPNNPNCTGAAIFTNVVPVNNGNGIYTSGPFTPTAAGNYNWVAVYSGDANNASATSPCGAPNETSAVDVVQPAIVTQASAPVPVGQPITDTATLSGGVATPPAAGPTGTIIFTLFGPNNPTCTGAPIFTDTVTVNGNGNYTSDPATPGAAGDYNWVAVYSGDANNGSVTSPCGAPNETSTVTQAQPAIVTQASGPSPVGQPITDTATLSGGVATPPAAGPTGTITFTLFGPNNPTCTGAAIFTSTVPVNNGNGTYTSAPFTPTATGTYNWVAVYNGDTNNAAATSPCGAPNEASAVGQAGPSIVTQASPPGLVGQPISDTATLSGGVATPPAAGPTGTIVFTLFGPNNPTCTGAPIYTNTVQVNNGNGNYGSAPSPRHCRVTTTGSRSTAATPTTPPSPARVALPTRRRR